MFRSLSISEYNPYYQITNCVIQNIRRRNKIYNELRNNPHNSARTAVVLSSYARGW